MKSEILSLILGSVFFLSILSPAIAQEATKIQAGDFEFTVASPWKDKNAPRPMVKAVAVWTDPDGAHEPIDCAFYHFGEGQGGTVRANVDRWKGQFQGAVEEDAEQLVIDGQKITLLHLRGTYMDGPMFGNKTPKKGYALLGAIFESPGGHVFLKATGPGAAIEASKASFRKMALSPTEK